MKKAADHVEVIEQGKVELIVSGEKKSRACSTCGVAGQPKDNFKCGNCGEALHPEQIGSAMIGKIVEGQYEIIEEIGSGAWGVVYKARQLELDRIVAIKVLRRHLVSDKVKLGRFKQEAKAASRLVHGNIIQVFDYGVMDQRLPFFVMEYLEAESLDKFFHARGVTDFTVVKDLLVQTLSALGYAHGQGVIHRDIKPGNILVRKNSDGSYTVKLLDFGIARLTERNDAHDSNLTATGELLGTPLYMSPEQCVGDSIDPRSDLYSLGCVIYEMLSGQNPFLASNSFECMMKQMKENPPELHFTDGRPAEAAIQQFLSKALAKQKESRYQSAAEMSADLQNLSDGAATEKTAAKLHPQFWTGTAICSLLLVGALLLFQWMAHQGGQTEGLQLHEQPAPQKADRNLEEPLPAPGAPADELDYGSLMEQNYEPETYAESLKRELSELEDYARGLRTEGKLARADDVQKTIQDVNSSIKSKDVVPMKSTNKDDPAEKELHMVAVPSGKSRTKFGDKDFEATVHVSMKGAPLDLLLSGGNVNFWRLRVDPGVRLNKVYVYGYVNNNIEGLPAGVPVESIKEEFTDSRPWLTTPERRDSDEAYAFSRFLWKKYKMIPHTMIFAQGKNATCTVGPENLEWLCSQLLYRLKPLYAESQAAEQKRLAKEIGQNQFWALYHKPLPSADAYNGGRDNAEHFLGRFDFTGPFSGDLFKCPKEANALVRGAGVKGPLFVVGQPGGIFSINPKLKTASKLSPPPDIPDPAAACFLDCDVKRHLLYFFGSCVTTYDYVTRQWKVLSELHLNSAGGAYDPEEKCFYVFGESSHPGYIRHMYKVSIGGKILKEIPLSRPLRCSQDDYYCRQQLFCINGYIVVITGSLPTPEGPYSPYMAVVNSKTGKMCYFAPIRLSPGKATAKN